VNGKIALEEHFAIEPTLADSAALPLGDAWPELRARLLDIHDRRIKEMDRHGIELMVLSLNAPAVQAVPVPRQAVELARRANDFLAERVAKQPDRFAGRPIVGKINKSSAGQREAMERRSLGSDFKCCRIK